MFVKTQSCPCGYSFKSNVTKPRDKLNSPNAFKSITFALDSGLMERFVVCPSCGALLMASIAEKAEKIPND